MRKVRDQALARFLTFFTSAGVPECRIYMATNGMKVAIFEVSDCEQFVTIDDKGFSNIYKVARR